VRVTAILPVKRFEGAKQRLKDALGTGSRAALVSAMLSDVLSALHRCSALDAVLVVSGEPAVRDLVVEPRAVLIEDTAEKGQSHAAHAGLARAAALGYERALLVPGDCPLIDPSEVQDLIERSTAKGHDVVIVPDRHEQGTNALFLDPSGPFAPQFGPDSLRRHRDQASRRGMLCSVEPLPSLALDVDTAEDLAALTETLRHSHGRAPRTEGVLKQIERSGQRPPVAA
jgi:2-phospho-L-lactate/phosphoenolpyruvate guanylyltransferase